MDEGSPGIALGEDVPGMRLALARIRRDFSGGTGRRGSAAPGLAPARPA
jgi:hypothetical protein